MNLIIILTEYTMYMNSTVINLISYLFFKLLNSWIQEVQCWTSSYFVQFYNIFRGQNKKSFFCSDSYNISLTGNLYFLYLIDIFYRWCFDHGDLTYQNWDKISCKCLCSKLLNSNKQGFNISSWAYFFLLNLKLPKFCYWILISNQILFFREIFQYIF